MSELPTAIRHMRDSGTYFSPTLSQCVLNALGKLSTDVSELEPRDAAIIQLISQGLTNAEIAKQLAISVHTVKSHVSQLLQKHQFRRRSELVKLAEHGSSAT
jgi:DNA-binding NarL/FixJ family response regulator